MLLQILGALKRLATKITSVRFQGYMDPNVGRNVVPLDHRNVTVRPPTLEVQIIGALAPNMALANVVLQDHQ